MFVILFVSTGLYRKSASGGTRRLSFISSSSFVLLRLVFVAFIRVFDFVRQSDQLRRVWRLQPIYEENFWRT
jgi:hypothetical protein